MSDDRGSIDGFFKGGKRAPGSSKRRTARPSARADARIAPKTNDPALEPRASQLETHLDILTGALPRASLAFPRWHRCRALSRARARAPPRVRARAPRRPPRHVDIACSDDARARSPSPPPTTTARLRRHPPRTPRRIPASSGGTRTISRRGALAGNAAYLAVSLPLWRDVLHDQGYLHGAEDEPAPSAGGPPGAVCRRRRSRAAASGAWRSPSTFCPASWRPPAGTRARAGSKPDPTYHEVGARRHGPPRSRPDFVRPKRKSVTSGCWTCTGTKSILPFRTACSSTPESSTRPPSSRTTRRRRRRRRSVWKTPRNANVFPNQVATKIEPEALFFPAEKYHQDFSQQAARHTFYRALSGRDEFVQSVWGWTAWAEYTAHDVTDERDETRNCRWFFCFITECVERRFAQIWPIVTSKSREKI